MHLIAPLAAGVAGAEDGTAFIYRRGTSSLVTYYEDFEATAAVTQSSSGIALDEHGGVVAYVDNLVRVVVKSSDGTTIREFTAGDKDTAVEVISQSFTGTDYVSGATGRSKPTTLQSVLDKWYDSAGAADFEVSVGGVSTDMQTAVQGLTGVFYNVKSASYGAVGDGTTDDYAACAAAITAASNAGGGIVVFPPGTYRITQTLTVPYTVSVLGCGAEVTHIKLDADTASGYSALYFSGTSSAHYHYQRFENARVSCAQTNTVEAVRVKDAYLVMSSVELIGSNTGFTDMLLEVNGSPTAYHVVVRDCHFGTVTGSTGAAIYCNSASSSGRLELIASTFKHAGTTFSASPMVDMVGTTSLLRAQGCMFDVSSATNTNSGTMLRSAGDMTVVGCHLKAPANGGSFLVSCTAIDSSAGVANESGNTFEGAGALLIDSSSSLTGLLDQIKLGSRPLLYKDHTSITAASLSIDSLAFGSTLVQKTSGATLTVNAIDIPLGHRYTLTIWNDGTGGSLTVTLGTGFKGTNMTVADNKMQTAEFISRAGPSGTVKMYQVGTPRDETE